MKNLLYSFVLLVAAMPCAGDDYAGSEQCRSCHADQFKAWRDSHHHQAMLPADSSSVLGRFDGQKESFHGVTSRFFRQGEKFLIETLSDEGMESVEIAYTFGFHPLQQYLVLRDDGHYQALNLAWDSRPATAGGQRWFHLRSDMTPDSPFFWTRHLQNWNAGCADCHSTGLEKNYDASERTYATTFTESSVGCEACHGPGLAHATKGAPMTSAAASLSWRFVEGQDIAVSSGVRNRSHIDMCGGCHSRRSTLQGKAPGGRFEDRFRLSLLEEGLYFEDGQINDEVFVLGSFLQSRMHQAGVTCMNCHDSHSGRLKIEGNGLCAQCHNPLAYDVAGHAGHSPDQAQCVDCHMPSRTYMGVDDRRDHRFGIPDPHLSSKFGMPDACSSCHDDRPKSWVLDHSIVRKDPYADLMAGSGRFDPSIVTMAVSYIGDVGNPAIKRATLLARLPLTREAYELGLAMLKDEEPMLRGAAISLLGPLPAASRYEALAPLLQDPVKSVRIDAARMLVDVVATMPPSKTRRLLRVIGEYRDSLQLDMAAGRSELGMLEYRLGRKQAAIDALEAAIAMEPHYVPALLNLADIYRESKSDEYAMVLLKQAIVVAPDSGAASHSFGLGLVRAGRVEESLDHLEAATERDDRVPRYAYVYAVALDSVGRTEDAVAVLAEANRQWPHQQDLLALEAAYRGKIQ